MSAPIPAIILAGSRPGPDPLLTGSGVSTKALLPIAGQAMLVHVVKALRASKSRPNAGIVEFEHLGINQRGEVVCQCFRSAVMKRDPALHAA